MGLYLETGGQRRTGNRCFLWTTGNAGVESAGMGSFFTFFLIFSTRTGSSFFSSSNFKSDMEDEFEEHTIKGDFLTTVVFLGAGFFFSLAMVVVVVVVEAVALMGIVMRFR